MGIDRHDVAQQDRGDEGHALYRHRGDRPLCDPGGDDATGDIHLAQHPSAENMPVAVDVRHARHHAQHPFAPLVSHCREPRLRSEEHTSELQSLMRISYVVFCLKTNTTHTDLHQLLITLYSLTCTSTNNSKPLQ